MAHWKASYLQNKEVRDAALQRMKHNCSSLGLEFGILYLTKDPSLVCYVAGKKT